MEIMSNALFLHKTKVDILNNLFVFFFVLSFYNFTYQSNIYILYSVIFIPFLLINRMNKYLHWFVILFISIFILQLIYHGAKDAFRIYKTFVVLLPAFLCNRIKDRNTIFDLLDIFVYINVTIVYIDFCLFFVTGITMTSVGNSGFMPRIGALTEDSNFYSYLILVYSFFRIVRKKDFPYICLFSIILSGSFAAILMSILLLFIYHIINKIETDKSERMFRGFVTSFTIILFLCYFLVVYFSNDIIDYFESLGFVGLLEIKLISMSHRFLVQNESMLLFLEQYNLFMGAGAGETINLNSLGLNLHNSYCQLLLESGLFCFLLVLFVVAYMGNKIHDLKIYVLFCSVFLLGCMMEILYFPLLSFIYYYDRSSWGKN